MKKFAVLLMVATFLMTVVSLNSCKKEIQQENNPVQSPVLKNAYDLNLMMGQFTDIGDVDIYVTYPTLFVDVILDDAELDGYAVAEAHLWAAEEPAPYPQSLFPNYWNIDMGPFPGSWTFDVTGYGTESICPDGLTTYIDYNFDWYFALHLQLEKVVMEQVFDEYGNPVLDENGLPVYEPVTYEETAWVLVEEGINWWNKKQTQTLGWGQYFPVTFDDGFTCPAP